MKDKCGIVGMYSNDHDKDVSASVYYALYALQHRGQESAGISTYNHQKGINYYCGMGLVSDVFKNDELQKLEGNIGIGHVRYSTTGQSKLENSQPFVTDFEGGYIAMAHNGDIVNSKHLRSHLEDIGYEFNSDTDSEVLCYLIKEEHSKNGDIIKTLEKISKMIIGSYSLVILINDELYALRDPKAMKPLALAKKDDMYVVASESVAFDVISAEFIRDFKPGEIISVIDGELTSHTLEIADQYENARCMFEYVYFARPDSVIDGKSVFDVRLNIGKKLYEEFPFDADLVVPVPDSSIPCALGYSRASGIEYGEGLIKNRYVGRTFIMPSQEERELAVKLKLNPLKEGLQGKDIVLIDDSIVRGTTSAELINILREAGARKIYLLIGCPPVIAPCFYGVAMASKDELIAANFTIDKIQEKIGSDALGYISIHSLVEAIGMDEDELCLGCINEKYPTEIPDDLEAESYYDFLIQSLSKDD
ncbi:amidophosphoribosyltransferase [Methanobrevibacter sp.]